MKGRVFDITRACSDDGPGLRSTVFLKGCHLDCPWCHNLEGKPFGPEIAFDRARCIGCGQCEEVCTRAWDPAGWRHGCTACGACAADCPTGARRLVGRELTPDQLVAEVLDDVDFFCGTGGGVTFSGGEPLAQPGFLFACAAQLKERGIHLAVETSGYWPAKHLEQVLRLFDLVLFDLKHADLDRCRRALGTGSAGALDNLERLLASRHPVEVRITLVPGFNDSAADLRAMADFLHRGGCHPPVRVQPFHRLAASKQALFDRPYPAAGWEPTSDGQLEQAAQLLRA